MTVDPIIYGWVDREIVRQKRIYPGQNNSDAVEWIAILCEETGDVARAYHHMHQNRREMQDQLLHVAAVAVRMLSLLGIDDEPPCIGHAHEAQEAADRMTA